METGNPNNSLEWNIHAILEEIFGEPVRDISFLPESVAGYKRLLCSWICDCLSAPSVGSPIVKHLCFLWWKSTTAKHIDVDFVREEYFISPSDLLLSDDELLAAWYQKQFDWRADEWQEEKYSFVATKIFLDMFAMLVSEEFDTVVEILMSGNPLSGDQIAILLKMDAQRKKVDNFLCLEPVRQINYKDMAKLSIDRNSPNIFISIRPETDIDELMADIRKIIEKKQSKLLTQQFDDDDGDTSIAQLRSRFKFNKNDYPELIKKKHILTMDEKAQKSFIDAGYISLLTYELSKYFKGNYHQIASIYFDKLIDNPENIATARKEISYQKSHAKILIRRAFDNLSDAIPF